MAQQVLDDFFKPNQPLRFYQFAQRASQLENMLNDFRPNLDVLQVGDTYALDISSNDFSAVAIINLITKTVQS